MKSTKTENLNDMDLLHTGLYGGQRWSRTTVLGFSDRRANRVRHLPIFYSQDTMFCFAKCWIRTNDLLFIRQLLTHLS